MSAPVRGRDTGRARRPAGRGAGRVPGARRGGARAGRTAGKAGSSRARRLARRRTLLRRWVLLLVAVALVGAGIAVLFTPLFGVRSIEVVGIRDLGEDQVRRAADITMGTPMARLDTDGISARVGELPRVASVRVERSLPGTVRLLITERTPVGVVKAADGVHLVDGTGKDYARVPEAPAGLPELHLTRAAPDDPGTRAVVEVLAALTDKLRPEVLAVTAQTGADVTLTLSAGRQVRWGDATDSARKAAILQVLLTKKGKVYDVSTPDLPTVS